MADKTAIDAPRANMFMVEPEQLTLVTDDNHPLYDPRVNLPVDENLVRNVMVFGVKEPVLVRKNGVEYEVVAGRQRTKAAVEANKRLIAEGKEPLRVRTIIERGDDADMFGVMILENELRQNDSPISKAKKAQRLLDMGKSEEWVATAFGVSKQTVNNYLTLLDLCGPVKTAVERGELSASAAAKMGKLSHDEQKQKLDTMRAQGGQMTAARAEKVARGENAPPVKRMRSRAKVADLLAVTDRDDEFGRGFKQALRWVLCE